MRKVFIIGALSVAVAVLFASGVMVGVKIGEEYPKTVTVRGIENVENSEAIGNTDFGLFWDAWQKIDENHLRASEVGNEERVRGAVRGLVGSLGDPHSAFFDPAEDQKFQEDIKGNFGGIGAEIGVRKEQLVVVAPLKDTPASKAGLLPLDRILLINTTSTEGMSVDEAVRMIRGPKGTEVTLTVLREGWDKPKEFKIVRDIIRIPTIDATMKEDGIVHVQLYSFNANAQLAFYEAAVDFLRKNPRGMILDLRNNPGGYLEVAVQLAGWFLPRGLLVVQEAPRSGAAEEFRANGNAAFKDFPLVILINEGSASASEILAGALRDHRHVKLIGEKSFGKGTVQQIVDLFDGSSMKLTVAQWVLPNGGILEGKGLEPDIVVKPSEKDIESGNDVQLTKAIEVMKEMLRER
jgi:carboxyl-terminal processing protease